MFEFIRNHSLGMPLSIIICLFVLAVFMLMIYALITGKGFSETPVSQWTIQEAIFYGAVVIGLSIFFK